MQHIRYIDWTQAIYISDTSHLYIRQKEAVLGTFRWYFRFFRVVGIFVSAYQSADYGFSLVNLRFPFLPYTKKAFWICKKNKMSKGRVVYLKETLFRLCKCSESICRGEFIFLFLIVMWMFLLFNSYHYLWGWVRLWIGNLNGNK